MRALCVVALALLGAVCGHAAGITLKGRLPIGPDPIVKLDWEEGREDMIVFTTQRLITAKFASSTGFKVVINTTIPTVSGCNVFWFGPAGKAFGRRVQAYQSNLMALREVGYEIDFYTLPKGSKTLLQVKYVRALLLHLSSQLLG
jgi:hypothetical protein